MSCCWSCRVPPACYVDIAHSDVYDLYCSPYTTAAHSCSGTHQTALSTWSRTLRHSTRHSPRLFQSLAAGEGRETSDACMDNTLRTAHHATAMQPMIAVPGAPARFFHCQWPTVACCIHHRLALPLLLLHVSGHVILRRLFTFWRGCGCQCLVGCAK
jgi:hypothetical protein